MTMAAHELMIRLLDYIVEQGKEIDCRAFHLSTLPGFKRFASDLSALPGVEFDVKVEGDHVWLRVERLEAQSSPRLPDGPLQPFILVDDDPDGEPPRANEEALAHQFSVDAAGSGAQKAEARNAARRTKVAEALTEYSALWRAWAQGEKPRRQSIALYGDLFALKHSLESEETARPVELVWGIGIAAWKMPCGPENDGSATVDFQYPLLTQGVELEFDPQTYAIMLRPRSVEPKLEFDVFGECHLQGVAEVERAALQLLGSSPLSPFDPGSFEPILKLIAGSLNASARYVPEYDGIPQPALDLLITPAWVLLSRPRSNHFLIDDIRRLQEGLQAGAAIPEGPVALVTPPSDDRAPSGRTIFRGLSGRSSCGGEVRDLFFPLPYNQEQETIVEQLERSSGIAVQGPPGTGKSHTIANIICHYLATGRRVLVTSKGEPALQVLQSKIPEEVRPLTVALLSGDREGMRQFQTAIETITHNLTQLNPRIVEEEIFVCKSAIDQAHAQLARIDHRIDEIAMAQLSNLEVDGVPLRAQQMSELVVSGRERHGWFDDDLSLAEEHAPPLSEAETSALREARRRLGADLVYLAARLPSSHSLPAAGEIGEVHEALVELQEMAACEAEGSLPALRAATPEVLEEARRLHVMVQEVAAIVQELEQFESPWVFELRKQCRQSVFKTEREALQALFHEMEELVRVRGEFMRRPVSAPGEVLEQPEARQAVARAAESGKPFGWLSLGSGEIKAQVNAIRVAGLPPASVHDWQHVHRYVELHAQVQSFTTRWNQFAGLLSVPSLAGGVESLRTIELVGLAAQKAHRLGTVEDANLVALAETVFATAPIDELQGGSAELSKVREHLRRHLRRVELTEAMARLEMLREALSGTEGLISKAFRTFVETELGDTAMTAAEVTARYAGLVSELRRIEGLAYDFDTVREMSGRVAAAGGLKLAARLRSQPVAESGVDRVLPVSWREAWNWARLRSHLDKIEAREELIGLANRRRDLEQGLARLYERLVSKSAWLATKGNAHDSTLSALETYRTAIGMIGQGTGPNATRHRRDARRAMMNAQQAVPCWIMSHAKVSETLPATLGAFDLVIVDEASQSNLWALPAVLRGQKILVVGDDKQVSPGSGFISATRIQDLRDRFLSGQPYAPVLTPEKSLYDLASTVFAGQKVMLREHFRCVPAIIGYSNRTFYSGFIQPLRIPKSSERIDPPLVDIFVRNGHRDANDVNRVEAEAIAAEIKAILLDPELDGRTIGVVSLLGSNQAKYIQTLVHSQCEAGELMRRKFSCGDARVFQGSERDIMFLSMVADSRAHHPLSGNTFEQRMNVAASRARDRMYLVRSVRSEELSPTDLRLGLLKHFSNPLQRDSEAEGSLVNLCESEFERQVYRELLQRGYRVTPQVKAGAFHIDMVVEGVNDCRLAIECDGDEFHGPDRWQADITRQRALERAGWVFWRCFASTWTMRKDEVLQELLARLSKMGIEPVGAIERLPALVEYREWDQDPAASATNGEAAKMIKEAIAGPEGAT